MRTDRRTHMTKLIVAFRSFAKGPEKAQQKISYWETGMLCSGTGELNISQTASYHKIVTEMEICFNKNK